MGKLFITKILFFCVVISMLFSCREGSHQRLLKSDDSFVKHKFTINGKTIQFSLPAWYTDKDVEDKLYLPQYVDNDIIRQGEFVFFSTKSDNSYFALYIRNDSLDSYLGNYREHVLDSLIAYFIRSDYSHGTVFTEKKYDKDRPYCFYMYSSKYYDSMRYSDPIENLNKSDSIRTEFVYITYYGMQGYLFILSSIESIKEFSYEEKRRVLESIVIE